MYLTRTSPITRESMAETMRIMVAENALWRCEGWKSESAFCQRGTFGVETMRDGLILPFDGDGIDSRETR